MALSSLVDIAETLWGVKYKGYVSYSTLISSHIFEISSNNSKGNPFGRQINLRRVQSAAFIDGTSNFEFFLTADLTSSRVPALRCIHSEMNRCALARLCRRGLLFASSDSVCSPSE